MQIITRSALLATLTGPYFDPDQDRQEEMTGIANAVLGHSQASYFVLTDHENGNDPVVSLRSESGGLAFGYATATVLPMTTAANGDYYGVDVDYCTYPDDQRALYQCYLGGCSLSSAPGFVLSAAKVVGVLA